MFELRKNSKDACMHEMNQRLQKKSVSIVWQLALGTVSNEEKDKGGGDIKFL
jgi:hypothetical protein